VEPFHVERLHETLATGLADLGLPADATSLGRWGNLARLLERWSERINLTGHRGAIAIAERLLLEAAALSQVLPDASSIADLGSGAGIPGLPLAICRPRCTVRMIESRERRHHFQRAAIRELRLENAIAVLGRAEELEAHPSEGVVAQAMAQPQQALRWMRRWIARGGWVAIPTVTGIAPSHPDLEQGHAVRYSAPRGPERSVWIARLPDPGPSS
jgi:16S rRNA (guanine527-N7)-methyltransferase